MSAPTALDAGALARQLFQPAPTSIGHGEARAAAPPGAERRSQHPVAQLARELNDVCVHAVDAAEIAAALEASGLGDREVRSRYGAADIFELAEILFELVPRRPEHVDVPDPWSRPVWRHLVHGALYAMPVLPYLATIRLLGASSLVWGLLAAGVVAGATTHGLSFLGHLAVGLGAPAEAARLMRRTLLGAALVGAVALLLVAIVLRSALGVLLVGVAQVLYVVAATALVVLKRERQLAQASLPVVLVGTVIFLAPRLGPWPVLVTLLLGALALVVRAAWLATGEVVAVGNQLDLSLGRAELRQAGLYGVYGAITAGLLAYAVVDAVTHDTAGVEGLVGMGMLPLVASLGIAEWQLYGFRSDCSRRLSEAYDHPQFARLARVELASRALAYLAGLTGLTLLVMGPAWLAGQGSALSAYRHLGYGALGLALLAATMLVSCGMLGRTVIVLGLTLALDVSTRFMMSDHVLDLTVGHVIVFAGLNIALWSGAFVDLASPARHR